MPRWVRAIGPAALVLALALLLATWALRPRPPVEPRVGQRFPAVALAPLPGLPPFALPAGRPAVVNLFASWCVPCRVEAPQLIALRRAGVAVVGIAVADTASDAARFVAETRVPFAAAGLDAKGAVQGALGTSGIPETWVVDSNGIIRLRVRGDLHEADVAAIRAITG